MMLANLQGWRVAPTLHWQEAFALWLHESNRAEKTIAAYLQDARHFVRWYEENNQRPFSFSEIEHGAVRAYFDWQKHIKAAVNSRNRRLASLRILFTWGIQVGLLGEDPCERILRTKQRRLPPRAKDENEFTTLSTTVTESGHLKRLTEKHHILGMRDRIAFGLMALAGLRIAEVANLDIDDLHLENDIIHVTGKGEVEGDVMISDEFKTLLEEWLTVRPGYGKALITDWNGERLSTGQIRKRMKLIGKKAGVALNPHDLRHTYIYRLLDSFLKNGMYLPVALAAVCQQARHGDSRTTSTYLRANYHQIKVAVESL